MSNQESDFNEARAALFSSNENPFSSRSKASNRKSAFDSSEDEEYKVIEKLPKEHNLPQLKGYPLQHAVNSFQETDVEKVAKNSSNKDRVKRKNKKKSQTSETNVMPAFKQFSKNNCNVPVGFSEKGQGDFAVFLRQHEELAKLKKLFNSSDFEMERDDILLKLCKRPLPIATPLRLNVRTQTENFSNPSRFFCVLNKCCKVFQTSFRWLILILVILFITWLCITFEVEDWIYKRFIQKEEPLSLIENYYKFLTAMFR